MKRVIICGQLFTSVDETVQTNMAVVIEDNIILEVAPAEEVPSQGCEVIDLSDKFVMAGLIDGHLHTLMNGPVNALPILIDKLHGDIAFDSMLNAQKDLMAGFTSIRDECSMGFADVSLKKAINAGKVYGPRMMVSGWGLGTTSGHVDGYTSPYISGECTLGKVCDSPDEFRKAARYNFKYGADQIKLMGSGGVLSVGDDPGAPEMTYEEMRAAIYEAEKRGRITSVHAHGAAGIKIAVKAGITSVEHGMLIDEEAMDMMAEAGTYLVPTIIAAYRIVENGVKSGIPEEFVKKAELVLENHYDNLKKMLAKGVKMAFGTDAGTSFNFHGEQGYEFKLMVDAGFTPEQTLIAATRTNAEMMKWIDKVGTVEAGKLADIVAFEKSPMEDITTMQNCVFVMKDGKVYKNV